MGGTAVAVFMCLIVDTGIVVSQYRFEDDEARQRLGHKALISILARASQMPLRDFL